MKSLVPILVLIALALLSFGLFYAPVIFSDDWWRLIGAFNFDQLHWIIPADSRPFDLFFYKLLFSVFGMNLHAFYLVKLFLICLVSIQLYFLFARILPQYRVTAFAFAAIYLIYPADQTRMWLTMLSPGWVLTIFYGWLLYEYMQRGSKGALMGAVVCFSLPLLEYEGQLGVAVAWCLLLFYLSSRQTPGKPRFALLTPLVIGLIYGMWKLFGPTLFHIYDKYTSRILFQPLVLIERLLRGLSFLVIGWVDFMHYWLWKPVSSPLLNRPDKVDLLLLLVLMMVVLFIGRITAWITRKPASTPEITPEVRCNGWKTHAKLVLIGFGLACAGYIPVIAIGRPRLDLVPSRFNFFAILGAALMLVGLLGLLSWWWARRLDQQAKIMLALTLPFLLVGISSSVKVQWEAQKNWYVQKAILRAFLQIAPGLADRTKVIFVITGYEDRDYAKRTPFVGDWEVSNAIQVLYNNQTLSADLYMPKRHDLPQARFLSYGVENDPFSTGATPYDRILVVIWDTATQQLHVASNLQKELGVSWQIPDYTPDRLILQNSPIAPLRYLVGAPDR